MAVVSGMVWALLGGAGAAAWTVMFTAVILQMGMGDPRGRLARACRLDRPWGRMRIVPGPRPTGRTAKVLKAGMVLIAAGLAGFIFVCLWVFHADVMANI